MAVVLILVELTEIPPFGTNRAFAFQVFDEVGKPLLFLQRHFHDVLLNFFPVKNSPAHHPPSTIAKGMPAFPYASQMGYDVTFYWLHVNRDFDLRQLRCKGICSNAGQIQQG